MEELQLRGRAVGAYVLSSSCYAVNIGWWLRQPLGPMKELQQSQPCIYVRFLTDEARPRPPWGFSHGFYFKPAPCSFYEVIFYFAENLKLLAVYVFNTPLLLFQMESIEEKTAS